MQGSKGQVAAAAVGPGDTGSGESLAGESHAERDAPPGSSRGRRPLPEITARCTGCGRCIGACAPRVLWLEPRGWEKSAVLHDPDGCTGCSVCAAVCPFDAIRMHRPAGPGGDLA